MNQFSKLHECDVRFSRHIHELLAYTVMIDKEDAETVFGHIWQNKYIVNYAFRFLTVDTPHVHNWCRLIIIDYRGVGLNCFSTLYFGVVSL